MSTAAALSDAPLLDSGYLSTLRQQMVKYARLHLNDSHQAEDAVQEALGCRLGGRQTLRGPRRAQDLGFAILKNKVADVLRHKQRMVDASSLCKEN